MSRLPLDKMTVEEKVALMEELWADLCNRSEYDPSPAWHAAVLAERIEAVKRGDEEILDWEEAKARIRKEIA